MTDSWTPQEALLVGSVPYETVSEVFTKTSAALPGLLHSIPDGEVGTRILFCTFQLSCFPKEVIRADWGGKPASESGKPVYNLDSIGLTGYDDAAISSYAKLVELRKQVVVPSDVRFQVCLPNPYTTTTCFVKSELCVEIEPLYEERLLQSIDRMLEQIPHDDMIIQWDVPLDIASLEVERGRNPTFPVKLWFSPVKPELLKRLSRIHRRIPPAVKIAFHFCYGDIGHAHWLEPEDLSVVVDYANDVIKTVSETHQVDYIHMPVPRDRFDAAYFEPLNKLDLNGTRLYLGLVRENDEQGTRKRIEVARATYPHSFGIGTECGLGRISVADVESTFAIMRAVTEKK